MNFPRSFSHILILICIICLLFLFYFYYHNYYIFNDNLNLKSNKYSLLINELNDCKTNSNKFTHDNPQTDSPSPPSDDQVNNINTFNNINDKNDITGIPLPDGFSVNPSSSPLAPYSSIECIGGSPSDYSSLPSSLTRSCRLRNVCIQPFWWGVQLHTFHPEDFFYDYQDFLSSFNYFNQFNIPDKNSKLYDIKYEQAGGGPNLELDKSKNRNNKMRNSARNKRRESEIQREEILNQRKLEFQRGKNDYNQYLNTHNIKNNNNDPLKEITSNPKYLNEIRTKNTKINNDYSPQWELAISRYGGMEVIDVFSFLRRIHLKSHTLNNNFTVQFYTQNNHGHTNNINNNANSNSAFSSIKSIEDFPEYLSVSEKFENNYGFNYGFEDNFEEYLKCDGNFKCNEIPSNKNPIQSPPPGYSLSSYTFSPPSSSSLSSFSSDFVKNSLIVHQMLADEDVNIGHFIFDDLFSMYELINSFPSYTKRNPLEIDPSNTYILSLLSCQQLTTEILRLSCEKLVKSFFPVLSSYPPLSLDNNGKSFLDKSSNFPLTPFGVCFSSIYAGTGLLGSVGYKPQNLHRSQLFYNFRSLVLSHFQISPTKIPLKHRIGIVQKDGRRKIVNVELIKKWIENEKKYQNIEVDIIEDNKGKLSWKEELRNLQKYSIIISPPGGISMPFFFLPLHSVLIVPSLLNTLSEEDIQYLYKFILAKSPQSHQSPYIHQNYLINSTHKTQRLEGHFWDSQSHIRVFHYYIDNLNEIIINQKLKQKYKNFIINNPDKNVPLDWKDLRNEVDLLLQKYKLFKLIDKAIYQAAMDYTNN